MPPPKTLVVVPQGPQRLGVDHDTREFARRREESIASHPPGGGAKQHIGIVQDFRMQIPPRDAGAKPEENGFDEQAIVRRRAPTCLRGPSECL